MSPPTQETTDLIFRLISANNATLLAEIQSLKNQLTAITSSNSVTDYEKQTIDDRIVCGEALDVIKSLPEFSGLINQYVSWREAAHNSMLLYTRGSKRYFSALTILRNKIVNSANDVLTSHGTVLNFDAIIARLEFAYADKRPIHIIEQELSVLRQGLMSIIDFYNTVNEKLTLLTNKTIMSHGTESAVTREFNNTNRKNALRVFITGLTPPLNNILFSLSPEDLPSALAKAQELASNQMRAQFAYQFTKNTNTQKNRGHNNQNPNINTNNLRFPQRNQQNNGFHQQKPEPMDVDPSIQQSFRHNSNQFAFNRSQNFRQNNNNNNNFNTRNTAVAQNTNNSPVKRSFSNSAQYSAQPQLKQQRVNNIDENAFLGEGMNCPIYTEEQQEEN